MPHDPLTAIFAVACVAVPCVALIGLAVLFTGLRALIHSAIADHLRPLPGDAE